jgi:3-oxoacyl-[acyl-carrier protein] reductase
VLVTGASRGLGRAIALVFGALRSRVAVHYHQHEAEARQAAEIIVCMQGEALLCQADVASAGDVAVMFNTLRERWGTLDVLVNNAAVADDDLLLRMTDERWQRVLDVDLGGALMCSRHAAAMMPDGGHIVNIASLSGAVGRAGQANYATAKAALIGLTRSLAAELGPRNVRVNAVLPGYLPTDMGRAAPDAMQQALQESVLARLGDPDEVAGFVAHLCDTKTISGQVFSLDSRLWGGT